MRVLFSKRFVKSIGTLPKDIHKKLDRLLELMRTDPYHPLLHTRRLSGDMAGYLSFRVTRDWRVIFQFISPNEIQLVELGNRKDIYK